MDFMFPVSTPLLLLLLIAILFKAALKILKRPKRPTIKDYKYKRREYLLTFPEHELFDTLVKVVGENYFVFPQVHLSTLFDHNINGQKGPGALSHIQRKSVDFVICDKTHIKPLLAIELDDSSHNKESRMERDSNVESIFRQAGLPLIRFKNHERADYERVSSVVLSNLN